MTKKTPAPEKEEAIAMPAPDAAAQAQERPMSLATFLQTEPVDPMKQAVLKALFPDDKCTRQQWRKKADEAMKREVK